LRATEKQQCRCNDQPGDIEREFHALLLLLTGDKAYPRATLKGNSFSGVQHVAARRAFWLASKPASVLHLGLHLSQAIFLFFAAVIAGTLNSIAGGGSFVSFPALMFTGVPGVEANATNTVAVWPGLAATVFTYLKRLHVPARLLLPLLVTSVTGGFAGALLLIKTPQRTFEHLVPWLLLGGTLLFAYGPRIRSIFGKSGTATTDLHNTSWLALSAASLLQLLVGTYGGYFGGGIGFVMMGMMAALGMTDIHNMNALRTLLAATINIVAVGTFIVAGAVLWPQCLVMIIGAMAGGWSGGHYAQKADPKKLRYVVILTGLAMTVYFFASAYLHRH
jgi:uncharacterized protein